MMMTIPQTAEWLRQRDNFLIITHRRPDGDTIGCAGALAQGLREYGKSAFILYNSETTDRYLPYNQDYWAPEGYSPEYTITIDIASDELFPKNGSEYVGKISLSIDHHPSNTFYAQDDCLDGTCASCGEIIYDILMELSGTVSAVSAGCIYVALSTDTGCFAFANTTARTLRVAALCIEAGAPHMELNRKLFRTNTHGRVKLEGMIYSGLEFHCDDAVAIASITREMMESAGANEDDVDGIAAIPGSIEGVLVGITIRELTSTQDCKVSVRSSPTVDSHAICAHFGGGGHPMAAGFSLEKTVDEIRQGLLEVIGGFLPQQT